MSGALLLLSDQADVQIVLGLIQEAALWPVDGCSVRPGLWAFFRPAFFQLPLYCRGVIRFFCDSGSVPYRLNSDLASGAKDRCFPGSGQWKGALGRGRTSGQQQQEEQPQSLLSQDPSVQAPHVGGPCGCHFTDPEAEPLACGWASSKCQGWELDLVPRPAVLSPCSPLMAASCLEHHCWAQGTRSLCLMDPWGSEVGMGFR